MPDNKEKKAHSFGSASSLPTDEAKLKARKFSKAAKDVWAMIHKSAVVSALTSIIIFLGITICLVFFYMTSTIHYTPVLKDHKVFKLCDKGFTFYHVVGRRNFDYEVVCDSTALPTTIEERLTSALVAPLSLAKAQSGVNMKLFIEDRGQYSVGNPDSSELNHAFEWLQHGKDSVMVVFMDDDDLTRISLEDFLKLTVYEMDKIHDYLVYRIELERENNEIVDSWKFGSIYNGKDVDELRVDNAITLDKHSVERSRVRSGSDYILPDYMSKSIKLNNTQWKIVE